MSSDHKIPSHGDAQLHPPAEDQPGGRSEPDSFPAPSQNELSELIIQHESQKARTKQSEQELEKTKRELAEAKEKIAQAHQKLNTLMNDILASSVSRSVNFEPDAVNPVIPEKQIMSAWNAVNVCGSDGLMHRGLVVDKTDSGLLIYFGISGKQPEEFSADRVFSHTATISNLAPGDKVFFLYQLSPQHAWTWYPANVLAASDAVFVLVDFVRENVHVREIFPWRRFQGFYQYPFSGPHAVQFRGQTPNVVKTSIILPDVMKDKKRFKDLWAKVPNVYPVNIEGTQLSYINDSQEHNKSLAQDDRVPLIVKTIAEENLMESDGFFGTGKKNLATVAEELSIAALPWHIIVEIFSYMHCMEHTGLRRICTDWNDIIELFPSQIVQVDLSVFNHWRMAVSLHKRLTRHTKYVLFVGGRDSSVLLGPSHTATLVQLANVARTKLTAIVVTNAYVSDEFVHRDEDPIFAEKFQAICGRVILRNVAFPLDRHFELMSGTTGQLNGRFMFMKCFKYDSRDQSALFDAFDNFWPMVFDSTLNHLADDLQFATFYGQDEHSNPWLQKALIQVIKKRQRGDARFGPDCSWMHVEAAQLHDVDGLRTLRKTTVEAMMQVMIHFHKSRQYWLI